MFILQDVVNFKMFIYVCKYIRKKKIQKEKAYKCFQKDYMLQEFFYLQIQIEEKQYKMINLRSINIKQF